MEIKVGNRRVIVIAMGLSTLLLISFMALFCPARAVGILTITGGAVGILLSLYFGADGYIKGKQGESGVKVQ